MGRFSRATCILHLISDQTSHQGIKYTKSKEYVAKVILSTGLALVDFEVLDTNWHPQSPSYVTSDTLSFKFLTQALIYILWLKSRASFSS